MVLLINQVRDFARDADAYEQVLCIELYISVLCSNNVVSLCDNGHLVETEYELKEKGSYTISK